MSINKKVVIIGAGPAGLTAGYELLRNGNYNVTILEELNEIGGISRTVNYKGNRIDIGGHRFFSKDDNIMNWWTSFIPIMEGVPSQVNKESTEHSHNPNAEDRVMLLRNRVSRIYYLKKFFDYPISLNFQTLMNMGMIKTIQAGFSYIFSAVFKRKEISLEDFFINRFGKKLYQMFFENYTEKVWGIHPSRISPEWGAQRVKGLSISKIIIDLIRKNFSNQKDYKQKNVETSLIEQFFYPKHGPGQLWELVADEIEKMGGTILKNSKVCKINIKDNSIVSLSYNKDGNEYIVDGDEFISSMPIKDLVRDFRGINVPKDIFDVSDNLPYRDFITVGILVKKMKIKNQLKKSDNELIPDCWIYIQEPNVKLGRLQIFNNWSPYMVKDNKKTVWLGLEYFCNEGDSMWNMPELEFINFSTNEIQKINIIDKTDVLDAVCIKVKKAYPAYFGSYRDFDLVKVFLNKIKNLYCIGRNGQHRYNNMDHSMLTAMEAVNSIITGIPGKDNLWDVNTEMNYHEVKHQKGSELQVESHGT